MRSEHSLPAAFRIRPARATDRENLAHLHREAAFGDWDGAALDSLLREASTRALVAETVQPETVCGFLLCRFVAGEGEILTFGVARAMRRRGIALALLTEVVGMARLENLGSLHLEVSVENNAALALYRRRGFREAGRRRGYYVRPGEPPIDASCLVLDLGRPSPEASA